MEFEPVESSNIKEIAFENDKLYVTFHTEKTYSYPATEGDFKRFKEAESKGRFFNTEIKNRPFEMVDLEKLKEDTKS
jgi:hypothetical protein